MENDQYSLYVFGFNPVPQGFDCQTDTPMSLVNKKTGESWPFLWDIKYYKSVGSDKEQSSGAYIFKPQTPRIQDVHDQCWSYGRAKYAKMWSGKLIQQLSIYQWDHENHTAHTDIILKKGDPLIQFDVHIDSIPSEDKQGKEVVASFDSSGSIYNNGIVYTDSNGLEMQNRTRDARPTWNLVPTDYVSQNFYPVNTAIAIRDEYGEGDDPAQMTVMNDRAQGGASLVDGRIQLMQNRRLFYDDGKGVNEALNEVNEFGKGIHTHNTYWMQLFQRHEVDSVQRLFQPQQDQPLQVLYARTRAVFAQTRRHGEKSFDIRDHIQGLSGELIPVKFMTFPDGENAIFVRIENLRDVFDLKKGQELKDTCFTFNIETIAEGLLQRADSSLQVESITEVGLTGNQSIKDMRKNKLHWKGNEDPKEPERMGDSDANLALCAQDIRSFSLKFAKPAEKATFLS